MDMKKIGGYIRRLRKMKKITQNQLGERLNISYQAVSKWERGEALPDVSILLNLASILQTTVDHILNGGEKIMDYTKTISVADVKRGIDSLAGIGDLIGRDNTIYTSMIEGINNSMNIDIQECLNDSNKREALVVEVVVQNIMSGAYVDISDAKKQLEYEHWKEIVMKYAKEHGLK